MQRQWREMIKPIDNDDDLKVALKEIRELWGAKRGTEQGDRLHVLATLVEAYEDKHHPMPLPDPIAAIKLRLEQRGIPLKVTDAFFVKLFGSPSKASEVLNRRRALSLPMIRRIHEELDLPLEILVQEVKLRAPKADLAKTEHAAKAVKSGRVGQTVNKVVVASKSKTPAKDVQPKAEGGWSREPAQGKSGKGLPMREDMPRAAANPNETSFKGVRKSDPAAYSRTAKSSSKKKTKG